MLLEVKGLKIPNQHRMHLFFSDLPREHPKYKPNHLTPLGDTPWPEDVKAKIVEYFKAIGIQDPLRQKLVEPYALAFGGRDEDGRYLLDFVDWHKLVDYFQWEANEWLANHQLNNNIEEAYERALKLQQKALGKYGGYYSHYFVYGD